jgi:hypothetical protein
LVPSRYALRVGEIDVLVVSDGAFPLPAATLATNADPAELAAWLDDRLQPPDVFKWPLNVVVVRSGGRTVLIELLDEHRAKEDRIAVRTNEDVQACHMLKTLYRLDARSSRLALRRR